MEKIGIRKPSTSEFSKIQKDYLSKTTFSVYNKHSEKLRLIEVCDSNYVAKTIWFLLKELEAEEKYFYVFPDFLKLADKVKSLKF